MSPPSHRRDEAYPAWPLGCAVAVLGFCLSFPIAWLVGLIVSAAELAPRLERLAPLGGWLAVPLLMLVGWATVRRSNLYAARVLLWGFAFTLVALATATAAFDFFDRLNGL